MSNIIDKIQVSGVTYDLPSGGSGKAVSGGTNISITTGETADTINCTLSGGTLINISNSKINCSAPIKYGTGISSVIVGVSTSTNKASGTNSIANGGDGNTASGQYSYAEGFSTQATKQSSHSEGFFTIASGNYSHAEGNNTNTTNESEHASGRYNNSVSASTTFGDSGNTLFSVGNGTADNARHNAFEIRQNGDIYITSGGTDIKLQDNIGGGGSVTIDPTLDSGSTNAVANSAITTALDSKYNSEYIPTIITSISTGMGNLNYLYRNKNTNYDSSGTILAVRINGNFIFGSIKNYELATESAFTAHTADTAIHVTTAQTAAWDAKQNALTIDSTVTSGSTNPVQGGAVYTQLGGMKLVKLTQSAYDALSPNYDANTLYVIVN